MPALQITRNNVTGSRTSLKSIHLLICDVHARTRHTAHGSHRLCHFSMRIRAHNAAAAQVFLHIILYKLIINSTK